MPNYYNPYQYWQQPNNSQPFQNQVAQPSIQPQVQQPQIQNGGFIVIPSEEEAKNYPVAPGNSITFKDEKLPYIYTKTMGFSQLDRPIFEKYKLIKEGSEEDQPSKEYQEIKKSLDSFTEEIESMWDEIQAIKDRTSSQRRSTSKKEKENEV